MDEFEIKALSDKELSRLHKLTANEIRLRNTLKRKEAVAKFEKGDWVIFITKDSGECLGMVKRVNKKTLTVVSVKEDSEYLIPPYYLTKATEEDRRRLN